MLVFRIDIELFNARNLVAKTFPLLTRPKRKILKILDLIANRTMRDSINLPLASLILPIDQLTMDESK